MEKVYLFYYNLNFFVCQPQEKITVILCYPLPKGTIWSRIPLPGRAPRHNNLWSAMIFAFMGLNIQGYVIRHLVQ